MPLLLEKPHISMESKEILPIIALQQIKGIGRKSTDEILNIFDDFEPGSPIDLLGRLKEAHEINKRIKLPGIQEIEKCWNESKEILKISQENNIKIISRKSSLYPKYLAEIPDPPALLHVKGNIGALSQGDMIAIVGTRKPTPRGLKSARKLGGVFANEGFVVVSGLAAGIDTQAHKGALDSHGTTIAVLAHGLHTIYPSENKKLADEIIEKNGALISEYPWGKNSFRKFFVERDRIQSGLSLGVLVAETGIKGGTMHTARFCRQQNRKLIVFSPKHFVEKPKGNEKLISDGNADIIFENDSDIELIKTELLSVRSNLSMYGDKGKTRLTNYIRQD